MSNNSGWKNVKGRGKRHYFVNGGYSICLNGFLVGSMGDIVLDDDMTDENNCGMCLRILKLRAEKEEKNAPKE